MAAGDISAALVGTIRARIAETAAAERSPDEIYAYLNEAQLQVVNDVCDAAIIALTEIVDGVFVDGTYKYGLPADFLRERYVELGGVPCPRIPLREWDALRANPLHTPSVAHPRYSLSDGGLEFFTNSANPTTKTYKLFYTKKPALVRAISTAARSTNVVTITTSANHDLLTGDSVVIEGVTPAGATSFNGSFSPITKTAATTFTYAQTAANDTGTGGRSLCLHRGQISTTEDPVVPSFLHGLLMDWAVMRCQEQVAIFAEAARQKAHYDLRMQRINRRFGSPLAHDDIPGDPRLQQQQAQ